MKGSKAITSLILVILCGAILQLIFINVDERETPTKVVAEFSKAYFKLDRSMGNWLCGDIVENEDIDVVGQYLNKTAQEAEALGYDICYMRTHLFQIAAYVISQDENSAEVRIVAKRKRLINPVFTLVAKIFLIGEEYHLDETIRVIKENGEWKVCGQPYSLVI